MALKTIINSQKMISRTLFKTLANYELRFVSNVKWISNSPKQTQMTSTSYGNSKIQTINKTNLPKNMILRHCSPTYSSLQLLDEIDVNSVPMAIVRRPLTLIFAWMLAKDKHLEKYRQLWFKRGFDVLTVRTTPLDLLLPPIGGRIVAQNLVKYLTQIHSQYNEIVVHIFSVGGYQFGETLSKLRSDEDYGKILNSIKGVIFDSCVFTDDCAPGLSRAITQNPIVQPVIESSIYVFLKLFQRISVKNYEIASNNIFNPVVPYKGLVLYSKDDIVSNYKTNEKLVENWIKRGNEVRGKCWDQSTHVLHYRDHQSEYEQELDAFLKSLKLKNSF